MDLWEKAIAAFGVSSPPVFVGFLVFFIWLELWKNSPTAVVKRREADQCEMKPAVPESRFQRAVLTFAEYLGNVSLRR